MKKGIVVIAVGFMMLAGVALAQGPTEPKVATQADILGLQLENINLKFQLQGCQALIQQANGIQEQLKAIQTPAKAEPKKEKK